MRRFLFIMIMLLALFGSHYSAADNDPLEIDVQIEEDAMTPKELLEAKRKQVNAEIKRNSQETKAAKAEKAKMQRELKEYNDEIALLTKKLKQSQEKLDSAKSGASHARAERDEKALKLAELQSSEKLGASCKQTSPLNANATVNADELQAISQLDKVKAEQARRENRLQQLRDADNTSKVKIAAIEEEIRRRRQNINKLEEEVKLAEAEAKASELRLQDSEIRLTEARERMQAQEKRMNERRSNADKLLNSANREMRETVLRMDQAQVDQSASRIETSQDASTVNVRMVRKPASMPQAVSVAAASPPPATTTSHMKLKKNCPVYDKATGRSKIIGSRKAGKSVQVSPVSSDWVLLPIKNRSGYLPRSCF
jgi:septal ring factor EnvC (AmiA/AmiB activator)